MNDENLKVILGQNIRKLRLFRNLTQIDFAEKVNISIPFLSDIENGKKWVSPVTMKKMANALNVDAYELLKPDTIVPDNAVNILEKYTAEIYKKFGENLNNIHKNYIQQINNKLSKK